eukprot:g15430.t1
MSDQDSFKRGTIRASVSQGGPGDPSLRLSPGQQGLRRSGIPPVGHLLGSGGCVGGPRFGCGGGGGDGAGNSGVRRSKGV